MTTGDSHRNMPLYAVAAIAGLYSVVPVALGWVLALSATDKWGMQHSWLGVTGAGVLTAAWLAWIGVIWLVHRSSEVVRPHGPVVFPLLQVAACYSPIVVRALLPWEEPGTGMGSPMAVLIHLVIFGMAFTLVFAAPAAGMMICVSRSLAWRGARTGPTYG